MKKENEINEKTVKNKTKKCYYCKNEIDKLNNICPFCKKNQSVHRIINMSIIAIFLGLITFILIVSRDVFTYGINSVITANNVVYKIESITKVDSSEWMGKLQENEIFLVITLSIKNNNTEDYFFNQGDWKLIIKDKEIDNITYKVDIESIKNNHIDNRKTVTKTLIYKINEKEEKLLLKYYDKNDIDSSFKVRLY